MKPELPLREILMRILLALERLSPPPSVEAVRPRQRDDTDLTIVTPAMRLQWQQEDEEANREKRPMLP